jgi:hypothetical protein
MLPPAEPECQVATRALRGWEAVCGAGKKEMVWVHMWVRRVGRNNPGEKKIIFGRNALQIMIFWYFIVFPPYPLPKIYDGWVQREG